MSAFAPTLFDVPRTAFGRLLRGGRRLVADADFAAFVGEDWPERIMHDATATTLHAKQGRTISRWSLAAADGRTLDLFLKRHYVLPRWQGLLAALMPSRAFSPGLAEWEHLRWAQVHGLPVARPVAAGEYRGPWGRLQSFLAVEELADMLPLHEAIPHALATLAPPEFARWKRGLVAELARLARELHRRSTFHKDLYLCHFYLRRADCEVPPASFAGRAVMIDFHRLAQHRLARLWFQVKDLAQLLFSTDGVPGLTARDRLRFWKLYRAGDWGPSAPPRNWVRGAVARKWKLYDRHNRKLQRERTP